MRALLIILALTACTPAQRSPTDVLDRLYFGRDIPGGGEVSDSAWHRFLADVVTPAFPDGLTWWETHGQWRDQARTIVRERAFVLELLHPNSTATDSLVKVLIAEYRTRFRQEAVLRITTTPTRIQFPPSP